MSEITKAQPTVISVKGDDFIQKEALSNEAITPGHLLELLSTGKVQKLTSDIANNTENISVLVALEDDLIGKDLTEDYATGVVVQYAAAKSGQEFLLRVPTGAAAIVIGDRLQSNGASAVGTVVLAAATDAAIAIAKEALTNNSGNELFILAEVI